MDFTKREDVQDVIRSAERQICDGMNSHWVKAYKDLSFAASVLDAFLARSTVPAGGGYPDDTKSIDAVTPIQ